MSSNEADNIDKLYKNYDILSDAKEKISEVSIYYVVGCSVSVPSHLMYANANRNAVRFI